MRTGEEMFPQADFNKPRTPSIILHQPQLLNPQKKLLGFFSVQRIAKLKQQFARILT